MGGKVHEFAQGVRLLTILNAIMMDRAIATPVCDRRHAMVQNVAVIDAALQNDGLESRDPLDPAGGNRALRPSQRLADRYETVMRRKPHIDSLSRMPELIER